jgi:ABC-2 type transport system permease protein
MQAYWTLTRRELAAFFLSMTGYIIIAAALFLLGFSFLDLIRGIQDRPQPTPVTEVFFKTWYFWLILLLTTPVITMRLFSLEKFTGTFETLMTTPVSEFQVVSAKFSAGLLCYILMWLPLLGCLFVVRHFSTSGAALDAGTVGGTFLGIVLLGGVFIALGCCASALTRSQVAAAMLSLAFGTTLFFVALLAVKAGEQATFEGKLLSCLALTDHMHSFACGVVDTRAVVLCVTLTLFLLFVTLRIVESRRWK